MANHFRHGFSPQINITRPSWKNKDSKSKPSLSILAPRSCQLMWQAGSIPLASVSWQLWIPRRNDVTWFMKLLNTCVLLTNVRMACGLSCMFAADSLPTSSRGVIYMSQNPLNSISRVSMFECCHRLGEPLTTVFIARCIILSHSISHLASLLNLKEHP
jgi:hypothetical protein